jgi:hypothetical protein
MKARDAAYTVFTEFTALHIYIRKKKSQINGLIFCLKKLEIQKQIKHKMIRRQIIKTRTEINRKEKNNKET